MTAATFTLVLLDSDPPREVDVCTMHADEIKDQGSTAVGHLADGGRVCEICEMEASS